MNIPYIVIEVLLLLFVLLTFINPKSWWDSNESFPQVVALIALMISLFMFPISFIPGTGKDVITVKNAYSQRVGNEIVVQVDGWPTKVVNNIEFVDVPLQMKRTEPHNAWNIDCTSAYSYAVQVNKPTIKTERQ